MKTTHLTDAMATLMATATSRAGHAHVSRTPDIFTNSDSWTQAILVIYITMGSTMRIPVSDNLC